MEWMKRCKREESLLAHRRIWKSACKRFRIVESVIKYGQGDNGLPTIYYAMQWDETWKILSRHRTRNAARKQIEHYVKTGELK